MKESIKWHDLRITAPYVMGQLSEKKVSAIIESLRGSQFANAKLITWEFHTAAISLVDGQKTVLNALFMDDENQYLISLEGISETKDSHAESKEVFGEKFMPLDDDIRGVGYRFLVNRRGLFGDFKIEPMVSDAGKYYYQWLLNKSEKGTIEDMLHDVQEEIGKERSGCYSVIRR